MDAAQKAYLAFIKILPRMLDNSAFNLTPILSMVANKAPIYATTWSVNWNISRGHQLPKTHLIEAIPKQEIESK